MTKFKTNNSKFLAHSVERIAYSKTYLNAKRYPLNAKTFWLFICVFAFCFFTFALTCFAQDKIIAIVNKDIITQKDLNDFINFMRVQ